MSTCSRTRRTRYRLIAPDMRGFGDTESVPIDATRGLRDWADDTAALVEALGVESAASGRLVDGRRGDRGATRWTGRSRR